MKKRMLIPSAALGGIAVIVASQYLNFNLGEIDLSPSEETNAAEQSEVSVGHLQSSENNQWLRETVKAMTETSATQQSTSEQISQDILLVDVLINGNQYAIVNVADTDSEPPMTLDQRQVASVEEIVTMAEKAIGDRSGTRIRISRTLEAVASAETSLIEALKNAGIHQDEVDRRSRLVE